MLDINERWVSKVINPDVLGKESVGPASNRVTMEELYMIRGVILYPYIITMLEKSMDDLKYTPVALKGVLNRCLEHIMFAVSDDYHKLRLELKSRNIRVEEDNTNDEIYYFRYYCRGFEDRFGIIRDTLRSEVRNIMTSYTADFGRDLQISG